MSSRLKVLPSPRQFRREFLRVRARYPWVRAYFAFPGPQGRLWTKTTYDNSRKRAFDRACTAAKVDGATPYALRHSFASLLLHEGRSVVYVARQLGHDARLTLTTYGHVIDELDELPRVSAEEAIRVARHASCVPGVSGEATGGDVG